MNWLMRPFSSRVIPVTILTMLTGILTTVGMAACSSGWTERLFSSQPATAARNAPSHAATTAANLGALDIVAGLCVLGAVGCVIASVFKFPVPAKLTIALVLCAIGAWTVKIILVQYLWLFAVLGLLGLFIFGMIFAYTHSSWVQAKVKAIENQAKAA